MKRKLRYITPYLLSSLIAVGISCSSENKKEQSASSNGEASQTVQSTKKSEDGIGPFSNVTLSDDVDMALVEQGKTLFEGRCTACHKFEERYVGPAMAGVTERRSPAWVMNMIINPSEMLQEDAVAKELLAEYMTPMVNMNVNEEDTKAIYEYLRAHDLGKIDN